MKRTKKDFPSPKRLTRRIKAAGLSREKKLNGPMNLRRWAGIFRENT